VFAKKIINIVWIGLVLASVLAACLNSPAPVKSPTPGESMVTPGPSVEAVTQAASPAPSATETPSQIPPPAKAYVLLITSPDSDPAVVAQVQPALAQLASQAGLDLKIQPALSDADLTGAAKAAIVIAPASGLSDFISKAPDTRFITLGIDGLAPAQNLTRLGAAGIQLQPAYVAGFIGAVLTPDWRAGILSQPVPAGGQAIQDAFVNGARYFCGLCRPSFPPFLTYPQPAAITADKAGWQSVVDQMVTNGVKTVYVAPQVQSQDLLDALAAGGVNLIGSQTPPDSVASSWIATVQLDYAGALNKAWPDILAGKPLDQAPVSLLVGDTGSGLLNSARQRLVDQVTADLEKGLINPAPVVAP
jgi:hypothetical protein